MEKSKSLYHISAEYEELMQQIENAEGEISDEVGEQLAINEKQLQSKSIAYLSVISTKEVLTIKIDEEIRRLQALKKHQTKVIKTLKERLLDAVNLFGPFEVGLTKFSTRKSESVEVEDLDSLPGEYKVIKITEQPHKSNIKKALKSGIHLKGCTLKQNNNLKIN